MNSLIKIWKISLLIISILSIMSVDAQTNQSNNTTLLLWPIEGKNAGEGVLYRPQDYIDKELNFGNLYITAELGSNIVCPCDGTVTAFYLVYYPSLHTSTSFGSGNGMTLDKLDDGIKDKLKAKGENVKYLSYMIQINSLDGKQVVINGLNPDRTFISGEKVKRGEILGKIHYCYKKIAQPCIRIGINKYEKVTDPMTPFGLKSTYIEPIATPRKQTLTRSEAEADYLQLASSIKEIYPSLDDFMTETEFEDFVNQEISKIPETISLADFANVIKKFNNKIHDSHLWFNYDINTSIYKELKLSPLWFAKIGNKMRVINTTEEYKKYLGREIKSINGKDVDILYKEFIPTKLSCYDANVESVLDKDLVVNMAWQYFRMDKDSRKGGKTTFIFADGEELTIPLADRSVQSKYDKTILSNLYKSVGAITPKGNWEHKYINNKTACISLHNFTLMETEVNDLLKFLEDIENRGCENLIIDLRNNRGGSMDLVTTFAEAVMTEPIITKGGYSKVNAHTFKTPTLNMVAGEPIFEDYKSIPGRKGFYQFNKRDAKSQNYVKPKYTGRIYVIINANTASAAALFAGIMKRNKRGYIIGRETMTAYHVMNAAKFATIQLSNSRFKYQIPICRIVWDEHIDEDFPYGRGVMPHMNIPFTMEEVTQNGDMLYIKTLEAIDKGIYIDNK